MNRPTYITTPIYYVNDAPHIGHVFSTLIADIAARLARLEGHKTFLSTGTDEHSTKVTEAARANGLSAAEWSANNATAFKSAFEHFGIHFDDFIRTSEVRHKTNVTRRIEQLISTGDVYIGEYSGWYDAGQEEYIPDLKAKQYDYISPINKKPLIQRSESNYFFKLSQYQAPLLALLEGGELEIQPPSRTAEIVARIKEGLNDIPISRRSSETWGIPIPGDEAHIVYVWIDALFNYLTVIDSDELRAFWPADTHVVGKDILWFHAVIWPALLLALQKVDGNQWLQLPTRILAHGFWIREGEKMSKSLGNFVGMADLGNYCEQFGVDGTRFYLASAGPVGANDSDFAHARFIEIYNASLANTVGNCFNRVIGMVKRYFDGKVPAPALEASAFEREIAQLSDEAREKGAAGQFDRMIAQALSIFRTIDQYVNLTEPYRLIKQPENQQQVGEILNACLQALRLGAMALWPVMPASMEALLKSLGCLQGTEQTPTYATCPNVPEGWLLTDLGPLFPRYMEPA